MKLQIFAATLLATFCGAALSAQAPTEPTFGEAVDVNVVNVDVYVSDKKGNRLADLQKSDFVLLEDGKPVEVTHFELVAGGVSRADGPAAPAPSRGAAPAVKAPEDVWNLVVLFDNTNMKPAGRTRAVQQLREFLTQSISPGDRVMLVTQDLGLKVRLPFSSDPATIERVLSEIGKGAAQGIQNDQDRRMAFDAMLAIQVAAQIGPDPQPCPQNIATPAHTYASSRRQEVLRALSSLTVLVNSLSGVPGRKAVLHVSDGLPLTPGEELFEFLIGICGGGGTAGLGAQGPASGLGSVEPPGEDESGRPERPSVGGTAREVDPLMVFDARTLGPGAYQAASQAPMDAQSYNIASDLQRLAAHANAQRVTLYTLQASGLGAPDASDAGLSPGDRIFQFPAIGAALRASNRDSLLLLADETGGRAILDTNDFRRDLARVREDFESYYSLGFTPAHTGDGREHRLEVKVKRPGAQLRYRQSYRDKPMIEKLVDRTLASLYHGIDENPLEITMEIGDHTQGAAGLWTVPVRLRIPLFKLAILNRENAYEGNLKLFVVTGSPDGANSPVRQVNVPIRIPRKEVLHAMGQFYVYNLTLSMKPGEHRLALAVRDELAANASYLSRGFTVGNTAAAARP